MKFSAVNVPNSVVSRSRISTTWSFEMPGPADSTANGVTIAVSRISIRLMPSAPTKYSTPSEGIHAWRSIN